MEKVYSSKSEAILARDYIEQRLKEITNLEVKLDKELSDFVINPMHNKTTA